MQSRAKQRRRPHARLPRLLCLLFLRFCFEHNDECIWSASPGSEGGEVVCEVAACVVLVVVEPSLVAIDATLDADVWGAEEDGASNEAAAPCIDAAATEEGQPVEVVVAPEARKDNSTRNASLLLCCVEATGVK